MLLIDPRFLLGSLLLALALDALVGDPRWLWRRLPHPVAAMGRAIGWLEERRLDGAAPAAAQA
ncbi:MAG: cobalamin biosynthesis protein, partial [Geminicoccaceae bacterium]